MNSKDIIEAFTYVAKEKNIEKNNLSSIIEEIFTSMIVKKYGEEYEENFSTIVNMDRGEIEIFHEKTVVDNVKNTITEISVKDAIKTDDTLVVGDMYIDIINPDVFGRRLIAHAKQHLAQKIKDIEKESVFNDFINKIDNIYSGYVHQIQRDRIFITDNDKIEIIIPKSEQIYNDHFKRGEQIRGLIKSVDFNTGRSPEIIMSRTDNKFLEKLFELEVPEIEDGIIEIKKISRSTLRLLKSVFEELTLLLLLMSWVVAWLFFYLISMGYHLARLQWRPQRDWSFLTNHMRVPPHPSGKPPQQNQ